VSPAIRRFALPLALLVIGLPVGVILVVSMQHDPVPQEASQAFRPISGAVVPRAERHAQPRWEQVGAFSGAGAADKAFSIASGAVQWRAGWRCASGVVELRLGRNRPVSKRCPGSGTQSSTGTGPGLLRVRAAAPWRVVVDQQVSTSLEEPPLAGMTQGSLLARGRAHGIQKQGEGTVSLYRLGDGRLAVRFARFYTSPSLGLELWLSRAKDPRSTLAVRKADYVNAGPVRSTYGNFNQVLPKGVAAEAIDSVVIWCPTVTIAFSAAPLTKP